MHRLLSLMLSVLILFISVLISAQVGASEQAEKVQPTRKLTCGALKGRFLHISLAPFTYPIHG